MRQQLGEEKKRKKRRIFAETGSKVGQSPDLLVDEAIDPADFFDPEEFDIPRKREPYRP